MKILNIKINNILQKDILEKIEEFLSGSKFHQIATINPEFILRAQKDEEFKNILNSCDLNIADGIGLRFAWWRFGKNLKCKFSGIDLMWEILKMANRRNLKVFLMTNKDGLSSWQETARAIKEKYPNLNISGINVGNKNIRYKIQDTESNLIFCNFGAPYQEKFISVLKKDNSSIRLAMGVGGSFDFITGKAKRAPRWMRFLGIEWLFRLIQQPNRIKRIFNAVIIFPIRIVLNK